MAKFSASSHIAYWTEYETPLHRRSANTHTRKMHQGGNFTSRMYRGGRPQGKTSFSRPTPISTNFVSGWRDWLVRGQMDSRHRSIKCVDLQAPDRTSWKYYVHCQIHLLCSFASLCWRDTDTCCVRKMSTFDVLVLLRTALSGHTSLKGWGTA